jgi:hypothetical protein
VTAPELAAQQFLPGMRVEAEGEAAQRMLACVKACAGIPTDALEAGILGDLLANLVAFYEGEGVGGEYNCETEMHLLERLGFLGGAAAACCARRAS